MIDKIFISIKFFLFTRLNYSILLNEFKDNFIRINDILINNTHFNLNLFL